VILTTGGYIEVATDAAELLVCVDHGPQQYGAAKWAVLTLAYRPEPGRPPCRPARKYFDMNRKSSNSGMLASA
jgi:tRNA G46 methylase TrmB